MKRVGTIKEIWRYPVKGMAGEKLDSCELDSNGLIRDRSWAIRDMARQEIQSCKFRPELLSCVAHSRGDSASFHVDIEFPDGEILGSDDPSIHERLSVLVGNDSKLERLTESMDLAAFKRHKGSARGWLEELKETFAREPGEAAPDFTDFPKQAQDFVTLPGTFFLVSPFHMITTSTMTFLKNKLPEADWDIRRFRPNILIATDKDVGGLAEQEWIGRHLTVGSLQVECSGTAIRCGAVVREQKGVHADKRMLRTIVKEADQNVGVYGNVIGIGRVSVGDVVCV